MYEDDGRRFIDEVADSSRKYRIAFAHRSRVMFIKAPVIIVEISSASSARNHCREETVNLTTTKIFKKERDRLRGFAGENLIY